MKKFQVLFLIVTCFLGNLLIVNAEDDQIIMGEIKFYASFNTNIQPGDKVTLAVGVENKAILSNPNAKQILSSRDGILWRMGVIVPNGGSLILTETGPFEITESFNVDYFIYEASNVVGTYEVKLIAEYEGEIREKIIVFTVGDAQKQKEENSSNKNEITLAEEDSKICKVKNVLIDVSNHKTDISWDLYDGDMDFDFYAVLIKENKKINQNENLNNYVQPHFIHPQQWARDTGNRKLWDFRELKRNQLYYTSVALYDSKKQIIFCQSDQIKFKTGEISYNKWVPKNLSAFMYSDNAIAIKWDQYKGERDFDYYELYITKNRPNAGDSNSDDLNIIKINKNYQKNCSKKLTTCLYIFEDIEKDIEYFFGIGIATADGSRTDYEKSVRVDNNLFNPTYKAYILDLSKGFADVSFNYKYYRAIQFLKEHEIMNGYSGNIFKPDNFVALGNKKLVNASGINKSFSDISENDWFAPYIYQAYKQSIILGYEYKTFKPARNINLAEALKAIIISFDTFGFDYYKQIDISDKPYQDVEVASWYAPYFLYAKDKNLIDADINNSVNPSMELTRGKFAEIVYRFLMIKYYGLEKYEK